MPPVSNVNAKTDDVTSLGRPRTTQTHDMAKKIARLSGKLIEDEKAHRQDKLELTAQHEKALVEKSNENKANGIKVTEMMKNMDIKHQQQLISLRTHHKQKLADQAKIHQIQIEEVKNEKKQSLDKMMKQCQEDKCDLVVEHKEEWKQAKRELDRKMTKERTLLENKQVQDQHVIDGLRANARKVTEMKSLKIRVKEAEEKVVEAGIEIQRIKDKADRKIEKSKKDAEFEVERMRNRFKNDTKEANARAEYHVENIQYKYSHSEINKRKKDEVALAKQDKNRTKNRIEIVEKCLDSKSRHVSALSETISTFNGMECGSHFIEAQKCFAGELGTFIVKRNYKTEIAEIDGMCEKLAKLEGGTKIKPTSVQLVKSEKSDV